MIEPKLIEQNCKDKCPKCNSDNLNYYDTEIQDNFIIYTIICDDCDLEFQEEYKLIYNTSYYYE